MSCPAKVNRLRRVDKQQFSPDNPMRESTTLQKSPRSAVLGRSCQRHLPSALRGQGAYVWDSEGKQHLDFSGSAAVNFIGHGVAEISAAIAEQMANIEFVHSSQFTTPVAEEYAHELLGFAGAKFRGGRVYFTSGGSESIETALKLARQYQVEIGQGKRYKILSRNQSYHGSTLGALAVSGNLRRREIYLPMVREFVHVGAPYCYRCAYGCKDCARLYAAEVERAIEISEGETAAFIFEPVSGATLGAAVPPEGYVRQVAEVCKRHGVLLIADEVMTGMGRTGSNFAVEHSGVIPDILVTAKGLSSGYAPLGAVIASAEVANAIASGSGSFIHGFTYNAHPVSLAAGRAVLRHLQKRNLVQAANSAQEETPAAKLCRALDTLRDSSVIGDVRGIGLLWGVEFVADKSSKLPFAPELKFAERVRDAAASRGVLVYPVQGCVDGLSGDHVLIAPPAVITEEQILSAIQQFQTAVEEAAATN
ncbi:MAG: aminotransferase class III-fold pyridoxal phosphate-dependent enzyme [Candidatus Sulfotelmatobacter sp.]